MTSYLIDINVWLAMTWDEHPQHVRAARWFNSTSHAALWFCRFTMLSFLRLLTNPKVMGNSTLILADALELYDRWTQDPRVALSPEPRGIEKVFRQALVPFAGKTATKAIGDCYLAGFAAVSGAQLVTFDKGLAQTAQSLQVQVTLLQPG